MQFNQDLFEDEEDNSKDDLKTKTKKEKEDTVFYLCKTCGAIIADDEVHNSWCTCGNTQKIKISKLPKDDCLNCGGTLRRFNLGYDAATGVVATSLYEQIPEYKFDIDRLTELLVQDRNHNPSKYSRSVACRISYKPIFSRRKTGSKSARNNISSCKF